MSFSSIVGLLFIAGVIGLVLIIANKKTQPSKPPVVPPVEPPKPVSPITINAPFTLRELKDQVYAEDVVLAFEPLPGEACGRTGNYGIFGVPYDIKTGRFADGYGINAKIFMPSWSEPPYSQPDGYDTVFVWSDIDNRLVPLGDNFTRFSHLRWFPGLRGQSPPYAAGPKGCPTPDPYIEQPVGGSRHTGRLIVTVKDPNGNLTRGEWVVGIWVSQCK